MTKLATFRIINLIICEKSEIMSNLAENLRILRERANLKQQNIADVVGIKRSSYAYYETGKSSPKIDALIKIAKLYNVSVDEILGDLEEPVRRRIPNIVSASIPPYADNEAVRIYDKFNDLSDFEKMMILKMRLMSPEEKENLQKYLFDNNKK